MVDTYVLESERSVLKHKIALSEALGRLTSNSDFVTVFEMHYFSERVSKLVQALGKDAQQDAEIIQALKEIGGLYRHLDQIHKEGAMAKDSLKELDAIPLSEYDYD